MNLFDRLRALLGLGDRRLRSKLGLAPDRRRGPRDRRDEEGSRAEALGDLKALAREKAERDAAAIRELERARDEGRADPR